MFENTKRHWDIARAAYQQEKKNTVAAMPIHQKDFLPAALEILEKPASPAGRMTIYLILSFFTIAVIWSIFGKLDVVAVAQGKVVTHGQSKIIQTFEAGMIRAINVDNGQSVKKGQVLIELDATRSLADVMRLQQQQQVATLTMARNNWLLAKLEGNNKPFILTATLTASVAVTQKLLVMSQLSEYQASQDTYLYQSLERKQQRQVTQSQLAKLNETLPLLEDQVEGIKELLVDNLIPRFEYLKYQERVIERRKDIIIQQETLKQIDASIEALNKQQEQSKQEFRKNIVSELADASNTLAAVQQELNKANQTNRRQSITSPVDGVIQQLAVHTIGGVVQSGDALMIVVPDERDLQVEVNLLNKDIGFVTVGQAVEVKLESFAFTKYGVVPGKVLSIDNDAVQDENLGLVYPARVSMDTQTMTVNGQSVAINPGMSLTAEVKIGKRRIIEFVMAPIFRYKAESLREH